MRSFIAAVLLFVLVAVGVTVNSLYVNNIFGQISSTAEQLSADKSDALLGELRELWYSSRDTLSISIKESKLERMSELIESLTAAYDADNYTEFNKLCVLISELCSEITQYERVLFHSII